MTDKEFKKAIRVIGMLSVVPDFICVTVILLECNKKTCGKFPHVSLKSVAEVFAVAGDDFFVPVEGILSVTVVGTIAFVVRIDINEAVAL